MKSRYKTSFVFIREARQVFARYFLHRLDDQSPAGFADEATMAALRHAEIPPTYC